MRKDPQNSLILVVVSWLLFLMGIIDSGWLFVRILGIAVQLIVFTVEDACRDCESIHLQVFTFLDTDFILMFVVVRLSVSSIKDYTTLDLNVHSVSSFDLIWLQ